MAVSIHPIQLIGNWDLGYSLDIHVISSTYICDDPYGNPVFGNTIRSELGELLNGFKYHGKYENLGTIVDTVVCFLKEYPEMSNFESIIPVPPTPESARLYHPTEEIARELANRLNVFYSDNILAKRSGLQLKNITAEEKKKAGNFIEKTRSAKRKHNVLLLDDLYQTGTTLSFCVERLREDPLVERIYVLTITKTKNS